MKVENSPPVTSVRIPPDLRRTLRIKAAEKDQSLTNEIVERLERSIREETHTQK